jgi:hypothetical protein
MPKLPGENGLPCLAMFATQLKSRSYEQDQRVQCDYSTTSRRRNHDPRDIKYLQDRLARVEALLSTPREAPAPRGQSPEKVTDSRPTALRRAHSFSVQTEHSSIQAQGPMVAVTSPLTENALPPTIVEDSTRPFAVPSATFNLIGATTDTTPIEPSSTGQREVIAGGNPLHSELRSSPSQNVFDNVSEDDGSSTAPPEEEVRKHPTRRRRQINLQ